MDFAFSKNNYILLFVGFAFLASGIILLIGGAQEDPTKLYAENPPMFNTTRLTIAPILLAAGLIIEIFAIMHKGKQA